MQLAGFSMFEDLLTDLIYLRKESGFTPRRMRSASVFLEVVGGQEQAFDSVKARLVSAINALPDQKDTAVLMAALALDEGYEGIPILKRRREIYGQKTGYKPDAVADQESAALHELAIFLLSARYAQSPLPDGATAMHSVAIHERVHVTTLVRDKLWAETREYYRTIPLIDGVEYFEISSDIPAKVMSTSDIVVKSESTGSGLKHRFYFGKPLKRGQPAELNFIMQPDGTRDSKLVLKEEIRAFHLPSIAGGMEILFLGDKPKLIWHYAQLPLFERPGQPTKQRLLHLGSGSTVRVEWNDLYGGLYSGVAWMWE
jgi:hypothetical protein